MAKARINKKGAIVGMELPECPVCLETMSAPIVNCQSGHSLCAACTSNLCPAICPICRQPMTQMRNRLLEKIIAEAQINCPNRDNGCIYTITTQEVENHLKECIFREMDCPLGTVFGKCSWIGQAKNMLSHFKDRHPEHCNINSDSDVELNNVSVTEDDRRVFLVAQGNMLFILTVKIDTIQKIAFWVLQHIGSSKVAHQYVYEIQIISKHDSRRKSTFFEYCLNDTLKPDEISRQGKCSIVPLNVLSHFIKGKQLMFKFSIKRSTANNQRYEKVEGDKVQSGPEPRDPLSSGPRPRGPGPRCAGTRGKGPRGSRPKSPAHTNIGHRSLSPFVPGGPQGQFKNSHPFHDKN